jgi:endonuclease YncB( thermonuclease family)
MVLLALWLGLGSSLLARPTEASSQPLQSIAVTVADAYDGELLEVALLQSGQRQVVRLTGIAVPPCVQSAAVARTTSLTRGQVVYLELSAQQRDAYGYLAGYIWVDAVMLNEQLVSEGLAEPTGTAGRYQQRLASARASASAYRSGGWSTGCLR